MRIEKAMAVFLGFSLFSASSGMTSAYLSSREIVQNVVTAGSVEVELTEPAWDPDDAKGLPPDSIVPKNPTVTNIGKNDAWIFLTVSVPIRYLSLVDPETKRKMEPADTELFSFIADENWELIETLQEETEISYIYGYKQLVKPQEQTTALFEEVKLVNYLEGELLQDDILSMPIVALAIQDHVSPSDASLSEIYRAYLKQSWEESK